MKINVSSQSIEKDLNRNKFQQLTWPSSPSRVPFRRQPSSERTSPEPKKFRRRRSSPASRATSRIPQRPWFPPWFNLIFQASPLRLYYKNLGTRFLLGRSVQALQDKDINMRRARNWKLFLPRSGMDTNLLHLLVFTAKELRNTGSFYLNSTISTIGLLSLSRLLSYFLLLLNG